MNAGTGRLHALLDDPARLRRYLVAWLYIAALGHLGGGFALSWIGPQGGLDGYLDIVEHAFWVTPAPPAAQAQQRFWFALFGATLQGYSIGLLALTHIGHRQRIAVAWGWMLLGLLVWGTQDVWLSTHAGVWINVVLDAVALSLLVPPVIWLWQHDAQGRRTR